MNISISSRSQAELGHVTLGEGAPLPLPGESDVANIRGKLGQKVLVYALVIPFVGFVSFVALNQVLNSLGHSPRNAQSMMVDWVKTCPENSVRFACNNGEEYYHLYGYIDFQKNCLGVVGNDMNDGGVTMTIVPGSVEQSPINPNQEKEIDRSLSSMPEKPPSEWRNYDFDRNIYLAFWKNHKLLLTVFPKDKMPKELTVLLGLFGPSYSIK